MEVFLSYSGRDDAAVTSLVDGLEEAGVQVWRDSRLPGADAWWRGVLERIRECDVFVFALSDNSLNSRRCRGEVDYALALNLPVLPVQIGVLTSHRAHPIFERQILDYREPTPAAGFKVMGALHQLIAEPSDLPDPLPEPPRNPYEYLQRLSAAIDSPEKFSPGEEATIVFQLRRQLRDADEDVVLNARILLGALRRRPDVTRSTARRLDYLLGDIAADPDVDTATLYRADFLNELDTDTVGAAPASMPPQPEREITALSRAEDLPAPVGSWHTGAAPAGAAPSDAPTADAAPPSVPPEQETRILPGAKPDGDRSPATTRRSRPAERALPFHEDVHFTVYRPRFVRPERWTPLLAFAHLGEPPAGADPRDDPIRRVKAQAEAILGPRVAVYAPLGQGSRTGLPEEAEITFDLDLPGFDVERPQRTFLWIDAFHMEEFQIRAGAELHGQTAHGSLLIYHGSFLLAEVHLIIRVDAEAPQDHPLAQPPVSASAYRKIFASYSHDDTEIVEEFERHFAAIGDDYLRDVRILRSGEQWNPRLLDYIEMADVFQLFWSTNAMNSDYVKQEWEYALDLGRPNFIRPTYWERPMPTGPGLPPRELGAIHFHALGTALAEHEPPAAPTVAVQLPRPAEPPRATPVTAPPPRPARQPTWAPEPAPSQYPAASSWPSQPASGTSAPQWPPPPFQGGYPPPPVSAPTWTTASAPQRRGAPPVWLWLLLAAVLLVAVVIVIIVVLG